MRKFGLSEFAPLIADALIPAVKVIPGKPAKNLPVGVSKFGGEPDLAAPTDWPYEPAGRPLKFVAQIRLSDLPPSHIPLSFLPRRGWLWFWYDELGQWLAHMTARKIDWHTSGYQVTFSASESQPLVRCPCPEFPEPKYFRRERVRRYHKPPTLVPFPQARVRFEPILSVEYRAWERLCAAAIRAQSDREDATIHFYYQALAGEHQLLGDIDEYSQIHMRENCEQALAARRLGVSEYDVSVQGKTSPRRMSQWRLLMKFWSDEKFDWLWGDLGNLCYWIRERDLARRDFSHVHAVMWSS